MKTIAILVAVSLAAAVLVPLTAVSLAVATLVPAAASANASSHSNMQLTQKAYPSLPKSS